MNILSFFPALAEKPEKRLNKNLTWTKRGPGRRHNHLTAKQQSAKEYLMSTGGMNASQALEVVRA